MRSVAEEHIALPASTSAAQQQLNEAGGWGLYVVSKPSREGSRKAGLKGVLGIDTVIL